MSGGDEVLGGTESTAVARHCSFAGGEQLGDGSDRASALGHAVDHFLLLGAGQAHAAVAGDGSFDGDLVEVVVGSWRVAAVGQARVWVGVDVVPGQGGSAVARGV